MLAAVEAFVPLIMFMSANLVITLEKFISKILTVTGYQCIKLACRNFV